MRTLNKVASAILLSAGALTMASTSAKGFFGLGQIQPKQTKEYLVTFDMSAKTKGLSKGEFMAKELLRLSQDSQLKVKKSFKHSGIMLIQATDGAIAGLKLDRNISSISENRVIADMPKRKPATETELGLKAQYQNVPSWGLDRVDQRYLTMDGNYHPPRQGAGVTAYILDTGTIATSNEFDDASGQTRLRMGFNPFRDNYDSSDCHGHGSHVAGTVGGANYGVAKGVNLVALRVMECGEVKTVANIVEGMEWVIDDVAAHQGPAVVNMSLSDPEGSVAWDNATQAMIDAGITVVVAAGNNFYDACINSPARLSDAITVGATDQYDHYNNLSNYGQCVDILAPGTSITSIDETGQPWTISGTSMAAPHVTGAAALVLERHPQFNHHQVKQHLLAHATQGVISGTAGAGDTAMPSANKLLYIGDELSGPLPQPTVNDGDLVQVQLLEGGYGYYKTQVGEGAKQLTIEISSQDEVDLYVKFDDVPSANPVSFHNDCKQTHFGGNERCEFTTPQAGEWHILIAASNPNADIQLSVSHDGSVVMPSEPVEISDANPVTTDMAALDQLVYFIDVPDNQEQLLINTSAISGNADMKIGFQQADNVICSSNNMTSSESCVIADPVAGRYFVTLDAVTGVSNLTLEAQLVADSGCVTGCGTGELLNLSGLGATDQLVYEVDLAAGKTLTVTTTGGSGDAELLVNYQQVADVWWSSDCYSRNSGNSEQCVITPTQSGKYYIVLDAYEAFDDVSLNASYK